MPVPKRYFKVSHEINHDPEVWELTDMFGERALRLWLQYLSSFDKGDNQFKLSGLWVSQLAKATKLNLHTVLRCTLWMIDRGWIAVNGEQRLAGEWSETARRLAEDWPKTHRRLAGDLPETHRRMVEDWSEIGRKLSLCAPNFLKYNRSKEQKGNANVPLLSDPTPTPTPTPILSLPKKEEEKNKKEKISVSVVPTKRRSGEPVEVKSGETWERYAKAYKGRYGADPVRNAPVSSMLCKLVDKLGADKAPHVAAFYVEHNNPFYVGKRHPVNLLLNDAEGLHTQWVTGIKATTGEAKNAERRDDARAQIERVKNMMGEK